VRMLTILSIMFIGYTKTKRELTACDSRLHLGITHGVASTFVSAQLHYPDRQNPQPIG